MTRAERELLIERYLNGEMSSTQEQDFFIQVAVDKELRQELKAYRTVESAIRKDREAERSEHTALRSRVASLLPLYPAPGEQMPVATTQPAADEIGKTTGFRFGSGTGRWLAATGLAVVLAVGTYLMTGNGSGPATQLPLPTPVTHQAPATPVPQAAPVAAPRPATVENQTEEATGTAASSSESERPATHMAAAKSAHANRSAAEKADQTVSPTDHVDAQVSTMTPKKERQRNDTANVGIRIQFPK